MPSVSQFPPKPTPTWPVALSSSRHARHRCRFTSSWHYMLRAKCYSCPSLLYVGGCDSLTNLAFFRFKFSIKFRLLICVRILLSFRSFASFFIFTTAYGFILFLSELWIIYSFSLVFLFFVIVSWIMWLCFDVWMLYFILVKICWKYRCWSNWLLMKIQGEI